MSLPSPGELKGYLTKSDLYKAFLGKLLWLLWVGRARHPGPFGVDSLGLEALNVGGWLTHGEQALDTTADFLAIPEHRLIPARVRSEWAALRRKRIHSVWAPASQEGSHVGHAGVGIVSLKGAQFPCPLLLLPPFALRCQHLRLLHSEGILTLVGWFVASCLWEMVGLCIK